MPSIQGAVTSEVFCFHLVRSVSHQYPITDCLYNKSKAFLSPKAMVGSSNSSHPEDDSTSKSLGCYKFLGLNTPREVGMVWKGEFPMTKVELNMW